MKFKFMKPLQRGYLLFVLFGMIGAIAGSYASSASVLTKAKTIEAKESYPRVPLYFEVNAGQAGEQIKFLARGGKYNVALTATEALFQPVGICMTLIGADAKAEIQGLSPLPGKSNYFIGADSKKWRSDVPQYSKVQYNNIYSNIDLLYYGNQQQLEYDFIVRPGASPSDIQVGFSGITGIRRDETGDLLVEAGKEKMRLKKPFIYQPGDQAPVPIEGNYSIHNGGRIGFEVGAYDRSRPLVIDPIVILYSTYLGGSQSDAGNAIAIDSAGNVYITGYTRSLNFPTANAYTPAVGVADHAFITKFNPATATVIYSTYLGGTDGCTNSLGIAVDATGNAVITGDTCSPTFPVVNPSQATLRGASDVFVTKINAAGSALLYSTYLGGYRTDSANDVAIDSAGKIYITGRTLSSPDCPTCAFPTTSGAFQTAFNGAYAYEAFVTKLNGATGVLDYSTLLGGFGAGPGTGTGDDIGNAIAVDALGNAYVTGLTGSSDFPTVNAAQSAYGGSFSDAFAVKLNPSGTALLFSTFLGGSNGNPYYAGGRETGQSIKVDTAGNAYISGLTPSTDFPTLNALQGTLNGCSTNGFLTKLSASGAKVFSTYLGGGCGEIPGEAVALDGSNNIFVAGSNALLKINPAGSALVYSFLNSVNAPISALAVDSLGNAYITGATNSTAFPIVNGFQSTYGGNDDAFFAKIGESNQPPTVSGGGPYNVNEGASVLVSATGNDPEGGVLSYAWDLDNNGSFEVSGQSVMFSASNLDGPSSGSIRVRVTDAGGLSAVNLAQVNILNLPPILGAINAPINPLPVNTLLNVSAGFSDPGVSDTHIAQWVWDDNTSSAGNVSESSGSGTATGTHTYTAPGVYTVNLMVSDDDGSSDTESFQYIVVYDPEGGFVTGGGWINSPAGAFPANPALTGKANFGFSAKYKKGASIPDGETEFNFRVGNVNFHSTSYDWLVVAGAKAQFKGTGIINGSGNYGFMITAIDGKVSGGGTDKFRIKIWNKSDGGTVVYDNQIGAPDGADPGTSLGGGSIVIHKP